MEEPGRTYMDVYRSPRSYRGTQSAVTSSSWSSLVFLQCDLQAFTAMSWNKLSTNILVNQSEFVFSNII